MPTLVIQLETALNEKFPGCLPKYEKINFYHLIVGFYLVKRKVLCFTEYKTTLYLFPKARRSQQKREWNEFKSQRHRITMRKEYVPDTTGLLHT